MTPAQRWRETVPEPDAYQSPPDMSRADRAREQDEAAGGRQRRTMQLPGGRTALASIALRLLPQGRRIYAYLRWSDGGKTHERYVCEVTADSRTANLKAAWLMVTAKRLTEIH